MCSSSSWNAEKVVSAPQKPAPSSSRRYPRLAADRAEHERARDVDQQVAHGHCPGVGGIASATPARAIAPTTPPMNTAASSRMDAQYCASRGWCAR